MAIATRGVVILAMTLVSMSHVAMAQELAVHTFQDLRVKPGQTVLVRTEDGKTVEGELVSIVGDQLELRRIRWFFRTERTAFTEMSVQRIQIKDSTWNGAVIGGGAGLLGAFLIEAVCKGGMECLMPAFLSIAGGPGIGAVIDMAMNRTIFTSVGNQSVRVFTVGPLVGIRRVGLMVNIPLP